MTWLLFAFITVASWGLYGVLLHSGQTAMADPVNGRYKAFLFVGVAYLLTAVLGSLLVLKINGVDWGFPVKGVVLSTVAGTAGALGAFGVLLAFGAKGSPAVVMAIVFAGAPVVNAVAADDPAPARRRPGGAQLALSARDRHGRGGRLPRHPLQAGVVSRHGLGVPHPPPHRVRGHRRGRHRPLLPVPRVHGSRPSTPSCARSASACTWTSRATG